MKNLLVFGSLRKTSKRGYNYQRFGGQNFIKKLTLDGFEMYSLGAYPAICKGEGKIKCELHEVEDVAAERIERMEIGAGYTPVNINLEKNVTATIYTWPKDKLKGCVKVQDGDWN